jgi:phosphopantothenoylcysteine decarboxylase / phosphopantothenate---cysteine ligase
MLAGRHIVLGVSGGVSAYKAAYLARRLVEHGAEVRAVMTASAEEFLGAQTLAAITGAPPLRSLFGVEDVSPHTSLARWADAIVVAPATAATIARLANGLSEDALSATVVAASCPVVVAPAMHTEMWEHPATIANIETLRGFGYRIVDPEAGALAAGDEGIGRLAEPEVIVEAVDEVLGGAGPLAGRTVLVNAGGTREPIDEVRYIGNRSSGKMGNALAVQAAEKGAKVVLVTTAGAPSHPAIEVVPVETAEQMAQAVWQRAGVVDAVVLAAAVSDFRPADAAPGKLRRADGPPALELEATPDVLRGVAELADRPFLVGFAAEVGSLDEAVEKAKRKGVDLLVANDIGKTGSGFGSDTNEVTLVFPDGSTEPWELMGKSAVASRLWDRIAELMADGDGS